MPYRSLSSFFRSSTELQDRQDPGRPPFGISRFSEVRLQVDELQELLLRGYSWDDVILYLLDDYHAIWLFGNVFMTNFHRFHLFYTKAMTQSAGFAHVGHIHFLDEPQARSEAGSYRLRNLRDSRVDIFSAGTDYTPAVEQSFRLLFQLLGKRLADLVEVEIPPAPYSLDGLPNESGFSPISADTLALLNCGHSDVSFKECRLSNDQCQAIASFNKNAKVTFSESYLEDNGRAILSSVGESRGPTQLSFWSSIRLDTHYWEKALSSTSNLQELTLVGNNVVDVPSLIRGLKPNRSLAELTFHPTSIDEEQWTAFIRCLETHPTLERLYLSCSREQRERFNSGEDRVRRARVLVEMLKKNRVLKVIHAGYKLVDFEIRRTEIEPRLTFNGLCAKVDQLLEVADVSQRKRLVGAALSCQEARDKPSLMWLLVSTYHDFISDQYELAQEGRKLASVVSNEAQVRKKQRTSYS